MFKSINMLTVLLALSISQTGMISFGYADDDSVAEVQSKHNESNDEISGTEGISTHKAHKKHDTQHENKHNKPTDPNGVKAFTPSPLKTVTPMPVKTITSTPLKTFTPTPIPTLSTTPSPAPAPAPAPAKTWAQYNRYCSGCHGASYQGASAALIQTGINIIPDMSSLKTLTAAQIAAIAAGQ